MYCLSVENPNVFSSICALVNVVVGDCVEYDTGWCGMEVGCDGVGVGDAMMGDCVDIYDFSSQELKFCRKPVTGA